MNLKNLPLKTLESIRHSIRRFPLPFAYVCLLTLTLIVEIIDEGDTISERFMAISIYYLSIGFVLSLTLRLWGEERRRSVKTLLANIIPHAILAADSVYLYCTFGSIDSQSGEIFVSRASAILAIGLSLCFLSFLREKDNIASWNFTMRLICYFCISIFIGSVMWGGLSLLLESLNWLFGIELDLEWYGTAGVLTTLTLSAMLFLSRIPEGTGKFDRKPVDSGFLNGVMRFLLLPLIGLYIVVLYIYVAQILVTWDLPKGNVSWLIVASMAGCIVLEFGLYPVRLSRGKKSDNLIARWLPVAILPLLLLMTIGIVRRINDYGLTIPRLYLATLNLWFYAVCIGLFVSRARRINWITISFALIFLLTSALPCNYIRIVRNYMCEHIEASFKAANVDKLPVKMEQYDSLMKSMPKREASLLNSRLMYLQNNYSHVFLDRYVDNSKEYISFYEYQYLLDEEEDSVNSTATNYCSNNIKEGKEYDLPEGYNKMYVFDGYSRTISAKKTNVVSYPLDSKTDSIADTIYISIKELRDHAVVMERPIKARCNSSKCTALITSFYMYDEDIDKGMINLSLGGVMFKKD